LVFRIETNDFGGTEVEIAAYEWESRLKKTFFCGENRSNQLVER